jgi:hypothetical protein
MKGSHRYREFTREGVLIREVIDGRDIFENLGKRELPLGDKIALVATPIARVLKMPCIDPKTGKLKPTSGCAKMKARLNAGMPLAQAAKLRIQGK